MSSIVRQKVGTHTYLYESVSYRNEEGKPRNRRVSIGKIDQKTGLPVYKQEYVDRMHQEGVEVKSAEVTPVFSVEDVRRSTMVNTGMVHLLRGISESIGLTPVLRETFPSRHQRILALASFLISCGEPVSYCADWMERSDISGVGTLSSPRVSELLHSITNEDRERFFARWNRYRSDREYLALDITSISSWSQLIDEVEWGYHRNGDTLPQINLCLLMGQCSHLPVRMSVYRGSIRDVSTLETTVDQVAPSDREQILIVMDKGFSSRKNINLLLRREGVQFLLALPLTMSFATQQLEAEREDIDRLQNTIVSGADILRGISKERFWAEGRKLFVHVFYHDIKATAIKNRFYGQVRQLVEAAQADPHNATLKSQFDRYLIIRRSRKTKSGYTINVREDVVARELSHAGWLVTVSNQVEDATEAISIYRAKDVVEKGFMRIKSSLGLDRLRVHSPQAMESTSVCGIHCAQPALPHPLDDAPGRTVPDNDHEGPDPDDGEAAHTDHRRPTHSLPPHQETILYLPGVPRFTAPVGIISAGIQVGNSSGNGGIVNAPYITLIC